MKYPISIHRPEFTEPEVIPSEGYLLRWLRTNYYSVFRTMHIRGWNNCKTWGEVLQKLAVRDQFEIVEDDR